MIRLWEWSSAKALQVSEYIAIPFPMMHALRFIVIYSHSSLVNCSKNGLYQNPGDLANIHLNTQNLATSPQAYIAVLFQVLSDESFARSSSA